MRWFGGEFNVLSRPWGRRRKRSGRRLGSRSFSEFGGLRVERSRAHGSEARQLMIACRPGSSQHLHKSETDDCVLLWGGADKGKCVCPAPPSLHGGTWIQRQDR